MSDRSDRDYMKRVLRLARKGRGAARPNPMVGALVVKGGAAVGEGYHRGPGRPHAEIVALARAGARAKGATLYINLEPCCHTNKRTPPCVEAILQSGVRKVVAAMIDPNPMVSGKGLALLRQGGVEVVEGILRPEAERLNEVFVKYMTTRRPFVTLKAAMTLDGRIGASRGESRWITGEAARKEVHRLRSEVDAVMVGIGTVLADDPTLTPRRPGARNPLRIVIDPRLATPLQSKLVASLPEAPVLLLTTSKAPAAKMRRLKKKGVQIDVLPHTKGEIPFDLILDALGKEGITHLLIEGGGAVNGRALRAGGVDRVIFYIAPKLLLGDDAKSVASGRSIETLAGAVRLREWTVRKIGEDLRVEGRIGPSGGGERP